VLSAASDMISPEQVKNAKVLFNFMYILLGFNSIQYKGTIIYVNAKQGYNSKRKDCCKWSAIYFIGWSLIFSISFVQYQIVVFGL
jgi:hypothetical protein